MSLTHWLKPALFAPVDTLPPIRKKYFEHGLAHTKASQAALKTMSINLRALRKKADMTQPELADKAGCSRAMITRIELALSFPSLPVYLAICRELGLPSPPLL